MSQLRMKPDPFFSTLGYSIWVTVIIRFGTYLENTPTKIPQDPNPQLCIEGDSHMLEEALTGGPPLVTSRNSTCTGYNPVTHL